MLLSIANVTQYSTLLFQSEEFYICILSHRYGDTILFHHEGGIDIGDVDSKVGFGIVPPIKSPLNF